jgi:YidC/Oxa1 family membrane protein insertase
MIIAFVVLMSYDFFIAGPARQRQSAAQRSQAQIQKIEPAAPAAPLARSIALAQTPRVAVDNSAVDGSIDLVGARFDDLSLKQYRQSVAKDSPEVSLLNPLAAKGAYDAYFGWEDPATGADIAGARTPWTAPAGARLTPQTPLTLTYSAPNGVVFTRTISVDDNFLFTISDKVENKSDAAIALRPFSVVRRHDLPPDFVNSAIVHQGLVGVLGADKLLREVRYTAAKKLAQQKAEGKKSLDENLFHTEGPGGWLGITDHYWLTALIPAQNEPIGATFDAAPGATFTDYRADYVGAARAIPPGGAASYTQHFFAGAKRVDILQIYQSQLGVADLDKAVDWGNFWFLTRPYFLILDRIGKWTGNFGLAILAMTILVKLALFPLVNQSFAAMAKMRKLQPQMKELQERFAADKQRQQQELMALYQREKINPVAGCLPILLQIPVFYALYKVLTVTIEMRHAAFFGWIKDLSAPDPTSIFNLFGLLPFNPHALPMVGVFLGLGAWPILYGATMLAVQSLSPPPPDPTQAQIFRLMPIIFMFLFASAAAGLVIYWTWSNTLSILQQYVIMRRNGVETEFDKFLARFAKKPASGAA